MDSDDGMEGLLEHIRAEMGSDCAPDYMVMGMSAETFWDGCQCRHLVDGAA